MAGGLGAGFVLYDAFCEKQRMTARSDYILLIWFSNFMNQKNSNTKLLSLSFVQVRVQVLQVHEFNVLNVSIRQSPADYLVLMPWAREEVFSFVFFTSSGSLTAHFVMWRLGHERWFIWYWLMNVAITCHLGCTRHTSSLSVIILKLPHCRRWKKLGIRVGGLATHCGINICDIG